MAHGLHDVDVTSRASHTPCDVTPALPTVVPTSPLCAAVHDLGKSPLTSTSIFQDQNKNHIVAPPKAKSGNGELGNDESPSTSTAVTKKKRAKKPDDMPRRPLSAYNIFFQNQRHLIVNEIEEDDPSIPFSLQIPRPPRATRCRKRLHRKMHGKIGFVALAKKIGKKWKALSKEEKAPYLSLAALEKAKYHEEMRIYAFKKKNPSWFSHQQLHIASAGGGHNISKTAFVGPPSHTTHPTTSALRRPVAVAPCGPGGHYNPHQRPVLFPQEDSRNKKQRLFSTTTIRSREQESSTRGAPSFPSCSSFRNDLNHQKIHSSSTTSSRGGGAGGPCNLYTSKSNCSNTSSSQPFYHHDLVMTQTGTQCAQNVANESSRDSNKRAGGFSVKTFHPRQQKSSFRPPPRATTSQGDHDIVGSHVRTLQERTNYFQSRGTSHHIPARRENGAVKSSSEYSPSTPPPNCLVESHYTMKATQHATDLNLSIHDSKNIKIDFETVFEDEVALEGLYEIHPSTNEKKEDKSQQETDVNHFDFEPYPFEETVPKSLSFSQDTSTTEEEHYFSRKNSHVLNGGNRVDTHHYCYNLANHQHGNNSHFVSPNNGVSEESYYLVGRESPFPNDKELCDKIIESGRGRGSIPGSVISEQLIVSPPTSLGGDDMGIINDVSDVVVNGTFPESELTNDEIADFLQPLFVENTEAV